MPDHEHPHPHPHGHAHAHRHGHGHHHGPQRCDRAFAWGIALNAGFVLVEAFYGWRVGSLALLADAAHNLSDVAGLVLAWAGAAAGRLPGDARHTYGWKRASILAALANALLLLFAMGSLAWEALDRLQTPHPTAGWTVMVVAGLGIVINSVTAWLFMAGRERDLNLRGAFLHMVADALVSAGVVLAGGLTLWQGWTWVDPVVSLLIVAVVVLGTWGLLRQSLHLLFDGVPEHIDLHAVRAHLLGLAGVREVHDLHVWALGTDRVALTAHLVTDADATDSDALLAAAEECLAAEHGIVHTTLQLEGPAYAQACRLRQGC